MSYMYLFSVCILCCQFSNSEHRPAGFPSALLCCDCLVKYQHFKHNILFVLNQATSLPFYLLSRAAVLVRTLLTLLNRKNVCLQELLPHIFM